jgi:hypothetical protein
MENGTIFLWKNDGKHFPLISKAIEYFTKSPYTHVAIYVNNYTYDDTIWTPKGKIIPRSGIRKTLGLLEDYSTILVPKNKITYYESTLMEVRANKDITQRIPYSIIKLLVLAIVYPTRWFWTKIKWVPFQASFFGEVCSTFVDEIYTAAKRDLFPGRSIEATVPGDFVKCDQLEIV